MPELTAAVQVACVPPAHRVAPRRRLVGRDVGRPCDGARRRGRITRAAIDDGAGRDIVGAVNAVGAAWFVAVVLLSVVPLYPQARSMSPWVTSLKTHPLAGPPLPLELQEVPWKVPPDVPYSVCPIW